jgi:elongation factor P
MAFGITDLRKGTIFQYEDVPYRVIEYGQKVMGRGGSIVNVKIKSLLDGRVLEKTFKGNEQLDYADVSNQNIQYLYADGDTFHFMDENTYEQFEIDREIIGDLAGYMKESDIVQAQLFDGNVIN